MLLRGLARIQGEVQPSSADSQHARNMRRPYGMYESAYQNMAQNWTTMQMITMNEMVLLGQCVSPCKKSALKMVQAIAIT
jgi:hypothetical protein